MMDIYKYPNIKGVYVIKKNDKLYNVLDSKLYDSNSFLNGGIILKSGKKTNKTSFPHDLMMNGLEDYKYKETSNRLIYDEEVWNDSDIELLNNPKEKIVLPQKNIAMNIQLIEDVIKEVDNIKKLFKKDDNTLKSQWFMDYVVFDEESPPSVLDSFRNREYKINKSIQKLNELSQSFEINNNHQMKLWFKIFFDLDDTSVTDKNMNLKEEFKEPITVRTNQLNQQLKEAETKMEAKEETHTSNNAPSPAEAKAMAEAAKDAAAEAAEAEAAEAAKEAEAAKAVEAAKDAVEAAKDAVEAAKDAAAEAAKDAELSNLIKELDVKVNAVKAMAEAAKDAAVEAVEAAKAANAVEAAKAKAKLLKLINELKIKVNEAKAMAARVKAAKAHQQKKTQ